MVNFSSAPIEASYFDEYGGMTGIYPGTSAARFTSQGAPGVKSFFTTNLMALQWLLFISTGVLTAPLVPAADQTLKDYSIMDES